MDRDEKLANFQAMTGIEDFEESLHYLESADWDVQQACAVALASKSSTHDTDRDRLSTNIAQQSTSDFAQSVDLSSNPWSRFVTESGSDSDQGGGGGSGASGGGGASRSSAIGKQQQQQKKQQQSWKNGEENFGDFDLYDDRARSSQHRRSPTDMDSESNSGRTRMIEFIVDYKGREIKISCEESERVGKGTRDSSSS